MVVGIILSPQGTNLDFPGDAAVSEKLLREELSLKRSDVCLHENFLPNALLSSTTFASAPKDWCKNVELASVFTPSRMLEVNSPSARCLQSSICTAVQSEKVATAASRLTFTGPSEPVLASFESPICKYEERLKEKLQEKRPPLIPLTLDGSSMGKLSPDFASGTRLTTGNLESKLLAPSNRLMKSHVSWISTEPSTALNASLFKPLAVRNEKHTFALSEYLSEWLLQEAGPVSCEGKSPQQLPGKESTQAAQEGAEALARNDAKQFLDANFAAPSAKSIDAITSPVVLQESAELAKSAERTAHRTAVKRSFVNAVSASLIASPVYKNSEDASRVALLTRASEVLQIDPEFILKVALYARQNLNIRTTSNFLLAFAALEKSCRPFLKKYFRASVRLPSDWLEVVELYETLVEKKCVAEPAKMSKKLQRTTIPVALRKAMVEKFEDFDEYQLAKHNKDKKTNKKKKQTKSTTRLIGRRVALASDRKAKRDSLLDDINEENDEEKADSASKQSPLNLKSLIRQLHISRPAALVMGLVGKKYPTDAIAFARSGLLGVWEEDRAGKRMKLKTPETWETQVAARGNKAAVWEDLIDHRKLPFMAMLRNLRNMIKAGISEKHHEIVLRKLRDEKAVISSRQFPFRFFSAYQALEQLKSDLDKQISVASTPAVKTTRRGVGVAKKKEWWEIKKAKEASKKKTLNFDDALLRRYQKALDTSVKIATKYNVQPIAGQTVVFCNVGKAMYAPCAGAKGLGQPRTVKEMALLLSLMCKHACEDCQLFAFDEHGLGEVRLSSKGTILDDLQQVLVDLSSGKPGNGGSLRDRLHNYMIQRKKIDNLIVISNVDESTACSKESSDIKSFLQKYRPLVNAEILYVNVNLSAPRTKYSSDEKASGDVGCYDERNVMLSGYSDQILRFVSERGGSGQLSFIDNIEKAYSLPKTVVPPDPNAASEIAAARQRMLAQLQTFSSTLRLAQPSAKRLRVFVSSTFKDMRGERDLLTRVVFPELKRLARTRADVELELVDLRWGVTEQQATSQSSVLICLREVLKCDLFIGLLGERYGHVPDAGRLNEDCNEPGLAWLRDYPKGRSVTELEIQCFATRSDLSDVKKRAFFYFRDAAFEKDVPEAFRAHVCSEGEEQLLQLTNLKKRIVDDGFTVFQNYACSWTGCGKDDLPALAGLQTLMQQVMKDVWTSVQLISSATQKDQPSSARNAKSSKDQNKTNSVPQLTEQDENAKIIFEQYQFIAREAKLFAGRDKLLKHCLNAVKKLVLATSSSPEADENEPCPAICVTGPSGVGKTAFLSALVEQLLSQKAVTASSILIPCFASASASAFQNISDVLRFIQVSISAQLSSDSSFTSKDGSSSESTSISTLKTWLAAHFPVGFKLLLLLDGFDGLNLNMLFDKEKGLPQLTNAVLVVSAQRDSSLFNIVCSAYCTHTAAFELVHLEQLSMPERSLVTKSLLATHGKALDESSFNNQMRLLTSKKDSERPAYLQMATEFLCLVGSFERLSSIIRSLPSSADLLIRNILQYLEATHGQELTANVLCLLAANDGHLNASQLYALTDFWTKLGVATGAQGQAGAVFPILDFVTDTTTWGCTVYLDPTGPPMVAKAAFLFLLNSASVLFKDGRSTMEKGLRQEPILKLASGQVKAAIRKHYGGRHRHKLFEAAMLKATAVYLLSEADPTFEGSYENATKPLLKRALDCFAAAGDWYSLKFELCSLEFLEAAFRVGVTGAEILGYFETLTKAIAEIGSAKEKRKYTTKGRTTISDVLLRDLPVIKDFARFVSENVQILQAFPSLILQQAFNQPSESIVYGYATAARKSTTSHRIDWLNRPEIRSACYRSQLFSGKLSCVAISVNKQNVGVGMRDGAVVLLDFHTGMELAAYPGHASVVTDVCFLDGKGSYLCSTSADGTVIVWNTVDNARMVTFTNHNGVVSACKPYRWGKTVNLVTVGWDCCIYAWNFLAKSSRQQLVEEIRTDSPINAIDTHPTTSLVVTAHWDATLKLHSLFPVAKRGVLRGHTASVRCVAYSQDGLYIVSACMAGEVKMWSASHGAQLGSFAGHSMPLTGVAFLPSGRHESSSSVVAKLATISEDSNVKIWSGNLGEVMLEDDGAVIIPASDKARKDESLAAAVESIDFTSDGDWVAIGCNNGTVLIFDVKTGALLTKGTFGSGVRSVKFGRNVASKPLLRLVVATQNKVLIASANDLRQTNLTLEPHTSAITSCDIVATYVATTHVDGALCLFNLSKQLLALKKAPLKMQTEMGNVAPNVVAFGHEGTATGCAFDAGLFVATVGLDKKLNIWYISTLMETLNPKPLRTIHECHADSITCVAWSSTKNLLVTGSNDGTIKIWSDLALVPSLSQDSSDSKAPMQQTDENPKPLQICSHPSAVTAVAVKKGCVVSAARDGLARVWSYKGVLVTQLSAAQASQQSPDAPLVQPHCCALLFGADDDAGIDWAEEMEVVAAENVGRTFKPKKAKPSDPVVDATASASKSNATRTALVACGFANGQWKIWNAFNGQELAALQSHTGGVLGVAGADESQLVTAGVDGALKWWNLAALQKKSDPNPKESSGSSGPVAKMAPASAAITVLRCVCDGDQNEFILTGSSDGSVSLWCQRAQANKLGFTEARLDVCLTTTVSEKAERITGIAPLLNADKTDENTNSLAAFLVLVSDEGGQLSCWLFFPELKRVTCLGRKRFAAPISSLLCLQNAGRMSIFAGLWSGEVWSLQGTQADVRGTTLFGKSRKADWKKLSDGTMALCMSTDDWICAIEACDCTAIFDSDCSSDVSSDAWRSSEHRRVESIVIVPASGDSVAIFNLERSEQRIFSRAAAKWRSSASGDGALVSACAACGEHWDCGIVCLGYTNGVVELRGLSSYHDENEAQAFKAHRGRVSGVGFVSIEKTPHLWTVSSDRSVKVFQFSDDDSALRLIFYWEALAAIHYAIAQGNKLYCGDVLGNVYLCQLR